MLTSKQQERKSKQRKIRNSEYYDLEGTFDKLYADSKKGKIFNKLMELIESEENIKLAYRTIKKNTGSNIPPKLDFERIETIAGRTGIPLVLHGGSGLSDSDFRTAVQKGICKINIFTDIDKAGKAGIEEGLAAGAKSMMGLIPYEIGAMKRVVRNKMELFGSAGRA